MSPALLLEQLDESDAPHVGGKALRLAALGRLGMAVPPGLCLPTDVYEAFVAGTGLRAVIGQELGRKPFADMRWEELWDASLRIRNRFLRTSMPPAMAADIEGALAEVFEDEPLVVRSSAPGEDGAGSSFAGLHDSFVGVRGLGPVLDAIRGVWASLWSDRALLYRRELGLDVRSSAMAVVIQPLVEGRVSGVAFGVHPLDAASAAVEAVYGLNQGLVDGSVQPDRWTLNRSNGRVREHVAPPERRRLVMRAGETIVEDVPPAESDSPPLDDAHLRQVFDAVGRAGERFGGPQDVEWTFADDQLVLLQARPVTAAPEGEGDKRAWYRSLTRSLENLRGLRVRVEDELLPAMTREADALQAVDLAILDAPALAAAIEDRRAAHDRWVDVYWHEFIPLAHGIRLFGRFYNDVMRPEDPHAFMELLQDTPMLSVRRNAALADLAARLRTSADLKRRVDAEGQGDASFEEALRAFEQAFGGTVYEKHRCFADRARLLGFLGQLAEAPEGPRSPVVPDAEALAEAFLGAVDEARRPLAREVLDLARASYRIRDDDNLHLARFEALVLEATDEGRRRLSAGTAADGDPDLDLDVDTVLRALRHPNLVVEPTALRPSTPAATAFATRPRQLVGQPAGPGVAKGRARIVETADDLFRVEAGDVLVCDAVDPNMTFVVPLSCAVIERRGGMLIHGAIIAREYGLPCVTGVPEATTRIQTGDELTVDGYLGIVTLVRRV